MARKSGGFFSKLVLLGVGAAIGSAMAKKKTETGSNEQGASGSSANKTDIKENIKKNLDRFNEQSGGMVDKVKPHINKAVDSVKTTIEKQQKMMDKEKEALDEANKTVQENAGGSQDKDLSGNKDASSPGSVSSDTDKPSGGVYGGSTSYTESLKKDMDEGSSSGSSSNNDPNKK